MRMTSIRPAISVPGKQLRAGWPRAIRDETSNMYPKLANWSIGIVATILRSTIKLAVLQRNENVERIQKNIRN